MSFTSNAAGTLVVIPAHNEIATIAPLVRQVRKVLGCPVLVVSDASRDGTDKAARVAGAEVLDLPMQLGAWGATQAGIRYALRHGYRRVLTMDADGQHGPESARELLQEADRQSTDVMIGTCPERLSLAKRIAWWWFRSLTGLKVEDLTSGLRMYGPRALRLLSAPDATLLDYQDVGVLMLLRSHGLSIGELAVEMHPRACGPSRVFGSWLMVAAYMLQTTVLCIARVGQPRRQLPAAGESGA